MTKRPARLQTRDQPPEVRYPLLLARIKTMGRLYLDRLARDLAARGLADAAADVRLRRDRVAAVNSLAQLELLLRFVVPEFSEKTSLAP